MFDSPSKKPNVQRIDQRLLALQALGLSRVKLGAFDKAQEILSSVSNDGLNDFRTRFGLGVARMNLGLSNEAASDFESAAKVNSTDRKAILYSAWLNSRLEKFEKAEGQLKHALELHGPSESVCSLLASVYQHQNREHEVEGIFRQFMDVGGDSTTLHWAMATKCEETGDYETALTHWNSVQSSGRYAYDTMKRTAWCNYLLKKYSVAMEVFEGCLADKPEDAFVKQGMALCRFEMGQFAGAVNDLGGFESDLMQHSEKAKAGLNWETIFYCEISKTLRETGCPEEARPFAAAALELNSELPEALSEVSSIAQALGLSMPVKKVEIAVSEVKPAAVESPVYDLQAEPVDVQPVVVTPEDHLKQGLEAYSEQRFTDALRHLTDAYAGGIKTAELAEKIGDVYSNINVTDKALEYYSVAGLETRTDDSAIQKLSDIYLLLNHRSDWVHHAKAWIKNGSLSVCEKILTQAEQVWFGDEFSEFRAFLAWRTDDVHAFMDHLKRIEKFQMLDSALINRVAVKLMDAQDWKNAEFVLQLSLKWDSKQFVVWLWLGDIQQTLGQLEVAEQSYRQGFEDEKIEADKSLRGAELFFNRERHAELESAFVKLSGDGFARNEWTKLIARSRFVRGDYDLMIGLADQVLPGATDGVLINELRWLRARSLEKACKYQEAWDAYENLKQDELTPDQRLHIEEAHQFLKSKLKAKEEPAVEVNAGASVEKSPEPTVAAEKSLNADQLLEKGKLAAEKENWDRAYEIFKKTTELDPERVEAWVGLARAAVQKRLYDEAEKFYRTALKLREDMLAIYFELGQVCETLNSRRQALDVYILAIGIAPDSAEAHYRAGKIYASLGEKDSAISEFRDAVRFDPVHAKAQFEFGRMVLEQGNKDAALSILRKAYELAPDDKDVGLVLGDTFCKVQRYGDALTIYNRVLEMDAGSVAAMHGAAGANLETNRIDQALNLYQAIIKIDVKDARALIGLARANFAAEKYEDAIAALEKASHEPGHDLEIQRLLAKIFCKKAEWSKAAIVLKRGIELAPQDAVLRKELGDVYFELGQFDDAEKEFIQAVKLDKNYLSAYCARGVTCARTGKKTDAIEAFRKALEIDSDNLEASYNLGVLYRQAGRFQEAEKMFEKSVEKNPQFGEGFLGIGVLNKDMGKHEEAYQAFQKAIAINPKNSDAHYLLGVQSLQLGKRSEALAEYRQLMTLNVAYAEDLFKRIYNKAA